MLAAAPSDQYLFFVVACSCCQDWTFSKPPWFSQWWELLHSPDYSLGPGFLVGSLWWLYVHVITMIVVYLMAFISSLPRTFMSALPPWFMGVRGDKAMFFSSSQWHAFGYSFWFGSLWTWSEAYRNSLLTAVIWSAVSILFLWLMNGGFRMCFRKSFHKWCSNLTSGTQSSVKTDATGCKEMKLICFTSICF